MHRRLAIHQIVCAFVAAFVGLFAALTFSGSAVAHHPEISVSTDRVCGDESPWTATVTARSDRDWDKDWQSRHHVEGATSEWSASADDQVPYVAQLGPFDASVDAVTVVVESQWFIKETGTPSASGSRDATATRPAATDCRTEPIEPTVSYDCPNNTIVIIGADDTASIDYTITTTDPADGEGDTWAITITAEPRPGFEFPAYTTDEWTYSGTVDCDDTVEPIEPTVSYDCPNNTIVIIGADDTASIDYTITTTDPADGEGDTWAITITATPQPGYEFPTDTTTHWDFTGTVDCLDTTTPTTPVASYDCPNNTIVIIGADDTASIDYTITTTDPADGEGDTWAITITATPQPGYEFPTDTTTHWDFTGTVDCLDTTTPTTPVASYDCPNNTIVIIGADDTASIDYTITTTDPADGEGDTWAITITATPRPGYEFPTDTTTHWDFTGTVDCLDTTTPTTPVASYDCPNNTIVIIGADDTASIDYTITTTDPADGEGDTWAITITAEPRPGFEFPAYTTDEWTYSGTVDCLVETAPAAPALVCENDDLVVDTPVSDAYTFAVDGDLGAAEGESYSITVVATPNAGYEFESGTTTMWTFTGTVDCIDEEQVPPGSTTTTTTTTTTTNPGPQTTTPVTRLPRTGSSSTSILLAYASVLVLVGGVLQLVRRTGRSADAGR
ncbi:MAG: hypothetical protein R8G01_02930 [Ilumatobacteraceae bacterium]|nr:hypothetical protein [Ilumatobacteraceae bacterium]